MSKLNLDFCDGNLHENSDDMMLPTFQLLSESSIPQPGSGSESEDDILVGHIVILHMMI